MRGTIWNENQLNSNFIHPKRSVGQVLFNGKINGPMAIQGTHNRHPLYPIPNGQYLEMMRKARRGDIVWAYSNEHHVGNLMKSSSQLPNIETDTIEGLVSINGHGQADKKETNHEFLSRIYPLGIAFMENDKNETDRFNCHVGGIDTICNNGNQRINAGDWVMAYAPSRDEVETYAGGRGEEADKNGVLTLWYVPYRPQDHKFTCNNIQKCLLETKNNKFTSQFKEASMLMMRELIKCAIATQAAIENTNPKLWSDLQAKSKTAGFDSYLRELTTDDTNGPTNLMKNLVPALCSNTAKQISPVGNMLIAQAWLIKNVTKNIMGKAVTSADPRKNFEIQQMRYAK